MQRRPKNPAASEMPEVPKVNDIQISEPRTPRPVQTPGPVQRQRPEIKPVDTDAIKDDAEVVVYKSKAPAPGYWSKRINEPVMFAGAIICSILFLILTVLVRIVDVKAIGPEGTSVGFATINQAVHELVGFNDFIYEITQLLGYFAILVAAAFALVGLIQLIKRKKLFAVDMEILLLGCLFIVIIGFYVFFMFVVINYRPVIVPGETEVEASFPSSHTMLLYTVMGAVFVLAGKYIRNSALRKIVRIVCVVLIVVMVVGRLVCGVHWFTDIIGGILLSAAMLMLYMGMLATFSKNGSN